MKLLLAAWLVPVVAHADRRDPFHPPAPDLDPRLVEPGLEVSVEPGAGGVRTGLHSAMQLAETAAVGYFVASGKRQALAIEVVETVTVVLDDRTPTLGFVGGAVHQLGRVGGLFDTARLGVGAAFSTRGNATALGLGETFAIGVMNVCGLGVVLHVDAYEFDAGGPDYAVLVGAAFAWSPLTVLTPPAPRRPDPPPPVAPTGPACANAAAITAVLVRHRKAAVDACNAGASDCLREHDRVVVLSADLGRCRAGEAVEVPRD